MAKTNIPYFSLRLLTVFSYFLPFVFYLSTCSGFIDTDIAFNTEDAIKNENNKNQKKLYKVTSGINSLSTDTTNEKARTLELLETLNREFNSTDNLNHLKENFEFKIFYPTQFSISAIGILALYKGALGKIMISLSIFISLVTLILWYFIDKYKIAIYFLSTNIIATFIFIAECYFSNISIQIGVWILLFLLIMQLLTEIQTKIYKQTQK